ncbi:spore coat protein [Paenibacillus larvae]|nr:spore coat protein [Paenibacillus larvae]MDT2256704.1 spore coat protein [Paenibacillus larvae]MDT2259081.1 spore coat protein [Paenibacillus larvae]MDT2263155.1 spore coat protein [Paenibacillus larvae]MDT2274583.1 spore coat protein [Paenibacillus larvae]
MIQSKTAQNEASSFRMEEQDQANVILSELKRTAREYTTAALEANHLQVREQFTTLLNQTLKHQAELYEAIRSLNAYGSVPTATAQEIQSESQKQTKSAAKLRALVHQFTSASSASVSGGSSAQGASNFVHAGSVTVDEADRQDSLTNTEGPLAQGQSFAQAQGSASQKKNRCLLRLLVRKCRLFPHPGSWRQKQTV